MCKQKDVLETIKKIKGKGGLSQAQIQLSEAQVEDMVKLKREISYIKQDVGLIKEKQTQQDNILSSVVGKLDLLIQQNQHKPFLQVLKELFNNKWFWGWAIIFTVLIFGASIGDLKDLLPWK